jgi:hypothetical protein
MQSIINTVSKSPCGSAVEAPGALAWDPRGQQRGRTVASGQPHVVAPMVKRKGTVIATSNYYPSCTCSLCIYCHALTPTRAHFT